MRKLALIGMIFMALFQTACSQDTETPKVISVGEQVYGKTCIACHSAGLNGAPIFGNKKMWDKRLGKGVDVLIKHAIEGYELMPAKGGNMGLSDDQVSQAVRYMVQQVQ